MKYVVVTGGVVSGLGKGITSSSIGLLLKHCGLRVTCIKIDPYLNVDAGTMSPYEHGEVFVLDDGGEADLDLGNYERFLENTLTRDHNITTGKVFQQVINRERKGEYLGKTVQVIPHVTDAVMDWIQRVAQIPVDGTDAVPEVCMIELGGTVGDIESMVFLEALRQLRFRVGGDNFCLVHVSLVPVVSAVGEPKSKPTQHSVRELRSAGLHPDLIVCRSTKPLNRSTVGKISMFCMVPGTHVCSIHDLSNIYQVPLLMLEQKIPHLVLGCLRIQRMGPDDLPRWRELADKVDSSPQTVTIAIVGKYTGLPDSYISITKSLHHAGMNADVKVQYAWVDSTHLEPAHKAKNSEESEAAWKMLKSADGILIPGGFGNRGIEGMILAAQYARTMNVPFLGICLGLQIAVIEFARNVCGLKNANSTEFDEDTPFPVVMYMPEISQTHLGGTMRLGARRCEVKPDTLAFQLYRGEQYIWERHRHRYEVNPEFVQQLEAAGLRFAGVDGVRMEIIELAQDPSSPAASPSSAADSKQEAANLKKVTSRFFLATQFHPEFKSRPLQPSPPFQGFVRAAAGSFVRRNPVKSAKALRVQDASSAAVSDPVIIPSKSPVAVAAK